MSQDQTRQFMRQTNLVVRTIVFNSGQISDETFDTLLNEAFMYSAMAVMLEKPDGISTENTQDFSNGVVIEVILEALKSKRSSSSEDATRDFFKKTRNSSNENLRKALTTAYAEMTEGPNLLTGIKHSEDFLLIQKMLGSS